jgi:hypothetical protein
MAHLDFRSEQKSTDQNGSINRNGSISQNGSSNQNGLPGGISDRFQRLTISTVTDVYISRGIERLMVGQYPWAGYIYLIKAYKRRKMWTLDGVELYTLAMDQLANTRYSHWPGIFEASAYFRTNPFLTQWHLVPARGSCRSNESPLLDVNRLIKAFFEFLKSLRIFLRAAVRFRQTDDPDADENNFWVYWLSPHRTVSSFMLGFLRDFFNFEVYLVSSYEGHQLSIPIPGEDRIVPFDFPAWRGWQFSGALVFNLLHADVFAEKFDDEQTSQDILVAWLRSVFPPGLWLTVQHSICAYSIHVLADAYMTSYHFPIALDVLQMKEMGMSPEIAPSRGNDLGNIDFDFITPHDASDDSESNNSD